MIPVIGNPVKKRVRRRGSLQRSSGAAGDCADGERGGGKVCGRWFWRGISELSAISGKEHRVRRQRRLGYDRFRLLQRHGMNSRIYDGWMYLQRFLP